MCVNCEHYELIKGAMGFCDWCSKEYKKKMQNAMSSPHHAESSQSPITLGDGGVGLQENIHDTPSPSPLGEGRSQSQEFSQEGQRWNLFTPSNSMPWSHTASNNLIDVLLLENKSQ